MKKLFFTFIVFFSLSCYSQEQSKSPGNQSPTTQVFMGHVIKLNLTAEGRYSYEIIHQGKSLSIKNSILLISLHEVLPVKKMLAKLPSGKSSNWRQVLLLL
jgi:hypothetical protein